MDETGNQWGPAYPRNLKLAEVQDRVIGLLRMMTKMNGKGFSSAITITVITNSRTNITPLFWSQMVPLLHNPSQLERSHGYNKQIFVVQ